MQFYDRLQDDPHIITITYWALRENPAPRMRSNPSSYPGALNITFYIACLSCIYFIGRDPTAQSLRDIWYTQYLPLLELLLDIFICLAMLFPKYGNEWIDLYWLDFFSGSTLVQQAWWYWTISNPSSNTMEGKSCITGHQHFYWEQLTFSVRDQNSDISSSVVGFLLLLWMASP